MNSIQPSKDRERHKEKTKENLGGEETFKVILLKTIKPLIARPLS